MDHTEYAVGQAWSRGRGIWKTGRRVADVDRRLSVTLLKIESLEGFSYGWQSAGIFSQWIEAPGATLDQIKPNGGRER